MMNTIKKYKFAVLGGDRRQAYVARELLNRGHTVRIFGLGGFSSLCGGEHCSSLERAIDGSDAVLLPLPVSRNGIDLLQAEDGGETVKLCEIIRLADLHGCRLILGGVIPEEIVRLGDARGVKVIDFYTREDLQRKNALPSAEGALMIAMEHTEITVSGMRALVTGFGRIGRVLASMLSCLGAEVAVAARREAVLQEIADCGYRPVRIGDTETFTDTADCSDVIFNTVPHILFGELILKRMKNRPLYIEIASSPGGIDLSGAREIGLRTVFAPSLPGKYAPGSAGRYIFETVEDILREGGLL